MQQRDNFLPFFLVFFALSFFLILLGKSGFFNTLASYGGLGTTPIRATLFSVFSLSDWQNRQISTLLSENKLLRRQAVEKQKLREENETLKKQLASSDLSPQTQLPARVIGAPGFIPGEASPQFLIIDKGEGDGVGVGSVAVLENNLVGQVIEVSKNFSKLLLVINEESFSAKSESGTSGIIKGTGGGLVFENVLLSQQLKRDALVLTKGDREEGRGYPPDLIVGKITSVERESQDLFQKAKVQSFLDFSNLTHIFIIR